MSSTGIFFIASGNSYQQFVKPLLNSIRKFWRAIPLGIHEDLGPWPAPCLKRFEVLSNESQDLTGLDYLYYVDVDSILVSELPDEIYQDRLVAIHHPRWHDKFHLAPWEERRESRGYVPPELRKYYAAGGFWGGPADLFLEACKTMSAETAADQQAGIEARCLDETYLNHYLWTHPHSMLDCGYAYPDHCVARPVQEEFNMTGIVPKILAVTKPPECIDPCRIDRK
jgi:hypothetical protein